MVEIHGQLLLEFIGADQVVDDDNLAAVNAGTVNDIRPHHEEVGVAAGGDGKVGMADFRFNAEFGECLLDVHLHQEAAAKTVGAYGKNFYSGVSCFL